MKTDINLEHLRNSWRSKEYSLKIEKDNSIYTGKLSKVPSVLEKNKIIEGPVSFREKKHPIYEIAIGSNKYDCIISINSVANNFIRRKDVIETITMKIGEDDDIKFSSSPN